MRQTRAARKVKQACQFVAQSTQLHRTALTESAPIAGKTCKSGQSVWKTRATPLVVT